MAKMVKTRLCIISDTHTRAPKPHSCAQYAYREPLPKADVLLHAGDLTMTGGVAEYEVMLNVFRKAEAEVKIVIAGNHDITLDEDFYNQSGKMIYHRNEPQDLEKVREMWTGNHAKEAGIIYLEEGIRTFTLHNGATFTVRGISIDILDAFRIAYWSLYVTDSASIIAFTLHPLF